LTSRLLAALRAAVNGLHADEVAAKLIISHGVFLSRGDFARYLRTALSISALMDPGTSTVPGLRVRIGRSPNLLSERILLEYSLGYECSADTAWPA
jgi:hypothetical protein